MKQVLKQLTILSSFIYALTFLGCTDMETFLPDIPSAFTYTVSEDTGTVTFINVSEGAQKYEWNFGDGQSSTEINPIKTYTASGTYTVTLKASNLAGASDTSEDQITIQIKEADCVAETEQSLDAADFNLTFQTDPGDAIVSEGGAFSYIDNPDTDNDVNPSCKVGQIDRDPGLEFANTQIEFDGKFDFNTNAAPPGLIDDNPSVRIHIFLR